MEHLFFVSPQLEDISWLVVLKTSLDKYSLFFLGEKVQSFAAARWLGYESAANSPADAAESHQAEKVGEAQARAVQREGCRGRGNTGTFLSPLLSCFNTSDAKWVYGARKNTKQYSFTTTNPAVIWVIQVADWPLNHISARIHVHSAVKIHHPTYLLVEGRLTCWCRWHTWLQSNLLIRQQNQVGSE